MRISHKIITLLILLLTSYLAHATGSTVSGSGSAPIRSSSSSATYQATENVVITFSSPTATLATGSIPSATTAVCPIPTVSYLTLQTTSPISNNVFLSAVAAGASYMDQHFNTQQGSAASPSYFSCTYSLTYNKSQSNPNASTAATKLLGISATTAAACPSSIFGTTFAGYNFNCQIGLGDAIYGNTNGQVAVTTPVAANTSICFNDTAVQSAISTPITEANSTLRNNQQEGYPFQVRSGGASTLVLTDTTSTPANNTLTVSSNCTSTNPSYIYIPTTTSNVTYNFTYTQPLTATVWADGQGNGQAQINQSGSYTLTYNSEQGIVTTGTVTITQGKLNTITLGTPSSSIINNLCFLNWVWWTPSSCKHNSSYNVCPQADCASNTAPSTSVAPMTISTGTYVAP